jgi:hypothetical protein
MAQSKNCPSCGAPLDIDNRFAKMVTCDFCASVILIHDKGLDPTGKTSKLAELPSMLYIDATGTIGGQPFKVLGRIRYQSESSYWDEWFLTFNDGDQPGWLQEDEGTFVFYNKQTLTGSVPPFDKIAVGTTVSIGGRRVFVSEKGAAQIAGGEGQLAFRLLPGQRVDYIDGNSDGDLISVEYTKNEIEFAVGRPIDRAEIHVDEEDYW